MGASPWKTKVKVEVQGLAAPVYAIDPGGKWELCGDGINAKIWPYPLAHILLNLPEIDFNQRWLTKPIAGPGSAAFALMAMEYPPKKSKYANFQLDKDIAVGDKLIFGNLPADLLANRQAEQVTVTGTGGLTAVFATAKTIPPAMPYNPKKKAWKEWDKLKLTPANSVTTLKTKYTQWRISYLAKDGVTNEVRYDSGNPGIIFDKDDKPVGVVMVMLN